MRRSIACFFAILAVLLLPGIPAHASEPAVAQEQPAGEIAATVNGVPIPASRLEPLVDQQLAKFYRGGMRGKATPEHILVLKKRALTQLIDQELLRQAVSKVVVPRVEEQAGERLAAKKASFAAPEQFARFLAMRNLTEEKLIENYRGQLQMEIYQANEGISTVEPTDAQIAEFYEKGRENFKREESVKARHILIQADEKAPAEVKDQARRKAEEVRTQLMKNPELFPQLAAQYSGCAMSKDQGGDLKYVKKGFMPPEFDAAAFTLPAGQISEVVATRHGYHIIQISDKKPESYTPLAEVHDFIGKYLKEKMAAKRMEEHIEELRRAADIRILL